VAAIGLALAAPHPVQAKTFHCGAGDVACLIAAITEANANGQKHNTIRLEAGTYTLTTVDNNTDGANGLPSVTSPLTIRGAGADGTTIERDANAPVFRLVHVAAGGHLTLSGLTLRGGNSNRSGGGLNNVGGTVTITKTTFAGNQARLGGGGLSTFGGTVSIARTLFTDNRGSLVAGGLEVSSLGVDGATVIITQTTFAGNLADGGGALGLLRGTAIIMDSTFVGNDGVTTGGGAFENDGGLLTIVNSTVAHNQATGFGGGSGGLAHYGGTTRILNSTIAENSLMQSSGRAGGIVTSSGTVELQNTILARNTVGPLGQNRDCSGPVTSLGNNLIGDPMGCTITLEATDLTGDPGLDAFTDNGRPGKGHFPLLSTSQAIDAGNDAVCPKRDQLRKRRVGPCDIGAIEFQDQDDQDQDDQDYGQDPATTAE
jgi:hypothetical protein